MKKLFTLDDFAVAFVSAFGYGFGEGIARVSGWSDVAASVASLAVGIALEEVIDKIVFSKAIQKKKEYRVMTFVIILALFAIAQCTIMRWMNMSLIEYVQEEFAFVIVLPVLGFIVNMVIRMWRAKKIREVYGDGSEGFVFDLEKEDIEEANRQNEPIQGEYDKELAVKTRTGTFIGEKTGDAISFLGIPYAKPPVGDLRWKAPEPLPSSDAAFEAKNFGASAIQVEHKGAILKNHRQSEDCLYLNICTGTEETEEKKPVLVLFHHGVFAYGGSADPILYGLNYVKKNPDTVFVSFNYRLGIFGFIDFSEVPGGEGYRDALNLGLLDQIAALKWIKENIGAFGGDPDRVTALGFEAGASSICMLAASERARGLFSKAFVFNGNSEIVYDSPDGSRKLAQDLLNVTGTSSMGELMKLGSEALKDAAQKLWEDSCAPTLDGEDFPADLYQAYRDGKATGIDFVIGIPANESQVFRSFIGEEDYEKFADASMDVIRKSLEGSPVWAAVEDYFKKQTAASSKIEAESKLIDQWLALSIYACGSSLKSGGNKVHLMYWDEKPMLENLGSGTVNVAATILGNKDGAQIYGNIVNDDLSETLQALLTKFVKGEALKLYPNEIKGVKSLEWKSFPKALIVEGGNITCGSVDKRLTEIEGVMENF